MLLKDYHVTDYYTELSVRVQVISRTTRVLTDGCQMGEQIGWAKKVKGLSVNWQLQNSHGDVKYSMRDRVNNTIVTMYGAKWVPVRGNTS